jgi:Periplasmic binding protein
MSMTPGAAPPPAAPILIGVLYDFPQADGGASVEEAIRLGMAEVAKTGRIDREFELVARQARGLPGGTAHHVETTYAELVDRGVLAVIGPSISDNGLIVAPLADRAGVPTINYTGGEMTRSEFMYHYQVGSLTEEPVVLVEYLVGQRISSVAALYDNSPVGRGYADALVDACAVAGLDITGSAAIAPLAEDVSPTVRRLRAGEPEGLVYLGLGVAARAVALAVEAEKWTLPVVANSSLMFGGLGLRRRDLRRERGPGPAGRPGTEDGPGTRRGGRLRHRPAAGRSGGPLGPSDPGRDQRRPGAGQAAAGGHGDERDDDGFRELRPRGAERPLSRPALLARREVGPSRRAVRPRHRRHPQTVGFGSVWM